MGIHRAGTPNPYSLAHLGPLPRPDPLRPEAVRQGSWRILKA